MSRKNILVYITFFITAFAAAQAPKKAERLFKKGDFINAAQLYEEALAVKNSKVILERLSDCYYNTYQYEKGLQAIKSVVEGAYDESDKKVDSRFNFMYYQLLSATGDYEKAVDQLVVYRRKMKQTLPDVSKSIEMVETFRLKKADFEIEKSNFNSEASDFAAVKLKDSVYFSSDRGELGFLQKDYKWTHRPFLDLYAVGLDSTNKGSGDAKPLPKIINSSLHEGSFTFTNDGSTMYFSRSNLVNGKRIFNEEDKNQIQLYVTKMVDGLWSEPKKLSFCSDNYNYQHPAVSPDGKTLYYSSDAPGSMGSYDIFSVGIEEGGSYGTPTNLGDKINTIDREQYPYVSEKGNLFFASNGHLGLGLLDIFGSELEQGEFTTPMNLGAPINSQFDDFSFAFGANREGYFSSNRDEANDDIFAFKQTGELFVREYVNSFVIKDSISGAAVPNVFVVLKNKDGKVVYENTLDEEGKFTANLLPGDYELELSSPGFETSTQQLIINKKNNDDHSFELKKLFDIDTITKNESVESKKVIADLLRDQRDPKVTEKDGKLYFDIPYIYFDYDKWDIRADSQILLNKLAAKIAEYPTVKIRIKSYTDDRGGDLYNQVLSEKRAQSSRDYLVNVGGIDSSRISFKGYGETSPLINCDHMCTDEEHEKNRRSQFEIIEY